MFTKNLGTLDRDIRLALGGVLILLATFFLGGAWAIVAVAVGVMMVATAALGSCPLYTLFHIDTRASRVSAKR